MRSEQGLFNFFKLQIHPLYKKFNIYIKHPSSRWSTIRVSGALGEGWEHETKKLLISKLSLIYSVRLFMIAHTVNCRIPGGVIKDEQSLFSIALKEKKGYI